jgi:hypothetical protein
VKRGLEIKTLMISRIKICCMSVWYAPKKPKSIIRKTKKERKNLFKKK